MNETEVEMAKRHVAEGEQRIGRQTLLIAQLEADGHNNMLAQARALLNEMIVFQRIAEVHLKEAQRTKIADE